MRTFFHYLLLTIGSVFVAAGLELILAPNGLVDGGVTAIAIMANELFAWPIWFGFLALNIPSLLFSGRFMGKNFCHSDFICKCDNGCFPCVAWTDAGDYVF